MLRALSEVHTVPALAHHLSTGPSACGGAGGAGTQRLLLLRTPFERHQSQQRTSLTIRECSQHLVKFPPPSALPLVLWLVAGGVGCCGVAAVYPLTAQ